MRSLVRQLRHYLKIPHTITLLTDQPVTRAEIEADEVLPLPEEPANAQPGKGGVRCFRRLRYFDAKYQARFDAKWLLSLDLDTLILDDITETIRLGMNVQGFQIIRGRFLSDVRRPYNGSMYLIETGRNHHVWDDFDWVDGPRKCAATGWIGSDQVWLSLALKNFPTWGPEHGVYFVGQFFESAEDDPPPKMLHYAGLTKPWSLKFAREHPELYQEYTRWL